MFKFLVALSDFRRWSDTLIERFDDQLSKMRQLLEKAEATDTAEDIERLEKDLETFKANIYSFLKAQHIKMDHVAQSHERRLKKLEKSKTGDRKKRETL